MKTFTIRGLDEQLGVKLKEAAEAESMSINQWILKMLRQVLGIEKQARHTSTYHDLDMLFGTWSEQEFEEFRGTQECFEKIDEDIWR